MSLPDRCSFILRHVADEHLHHTKTSRFQRIDAQFFGKDPEQSKLYQLITSAALGKIDYGNAKTQEAIDSVLKETPTSPREKLKIKAASWIHHHGKGSKTARYEEKFERIIRKIEKMWKSSSDLNPTELFRNALEQHDAATLSFLLKNDPSYKRDEHMDSACALLKFHEEDLSVEELATLFATAQTDPKKYRKLETTILEIAKKRGIQEEMKTVEEKKKAIEEGKKADAFVPTFERAIKTKDWTTLNTMLRDPSIASRLAHNVPLFKKGLHILIQMVAQTLDLKSTQILMEDILKLRQHHPDPLTASEAIELTQMILNGIPKNKESRARIQEKVMQTTAKHLANQKMGGQLLQEACRAGDPVFVQNILSVGISFRPGSTFPISVDDYAQALQIACKMNDRILVSILCANSGDNEIIQNTARELLKTKLPRGIQEELQMFLKI